MTTTLRALPVPSGGTAGHVCGYARVRTRDQTADLQEDALRAAGAIRIWTDTASGATTSRPQLDALLEALLPGVLLCVWCLDRMGRSMGHLVATVDDLAARGVGFRSLTEQIDTTTAARRLNLGIFAARAEFERALISERTIAELEDAWTRGARLGRSTVVTPTKLAAARGPIESGSTVTWAAAAIGISRPTLYRHLAEAMVCS